MRKFLTATMTLGLMAAAAQAALIFDEDFGTLADGTTIATDGSNTDFTYVRVGGGGGSIEALNPSTIGDGASLKIVGPTTGSLNGVGVGTGLGGGDLLTLMFSLKMSDASGDFFVGAGQGTMFTSDVTFNTSHLMWGIQSDSGNLEYRTGSGWSNVGTTLGGNTQYDFVIQANNTLAESNGLAAGKMNIYLNDSLIADEIDITGNQSADGFRMYAVGATGSTATYEIDDIKVYNEVIPEPGTLALLLAGLGSLLAVRRFRRG